MFDIIGIGAINFDFIFPTVLLPCIEHAAGEETFVDEAEFENLYNSVITSSNQVYYQIGGSALLALSALHNCDNSLLGGLVGIYGTLNQKSLNVGFPSYLEFIAKAQELIGDTSWLLSSTKPVGTSLVVLNKAQRAFIKIFPGANDAIKEAIEAYDIDFLKFLEYLSRARCIHLSSFGDYNQFDFFVDCIIKAKNKNHELIVSIDPGYEYTYSRWYAFKKSFQVLDYLFLSESEYQNLCRNTDGSELKLLDYISAKCNVKIIVKKRAGAIIIDSKNKTKTLYSHEIIDDSEIICDTRAGDAFAGGFLAGLLNKRDESECVRLGGKSAINVLKNIPTIITK